MGIGIEGHSEEAVKAAVARAFNRFLGLYARFGQHRFHGSSDHKDPRTFRGPMFWSEADCVFRLGLELEKEFPGCVHLGFELSRSTLSPFDPDAGDVRSEVDLAVSDLAGFEPDERSHSQFGSRQHELFLEAKYLPKGHWTRDVKKKIERDIPANFAVQAARLERKRCLVAGCLIVDDDDHVFRAFQQGHLTPPPKLVLLHASPSLLEQRGIEAT
jgi:hypothetical protein